MLTANAKFYLGQPADRRSGLAHLQGTTTNGKCLLPFKTGAFLAGAPVQPVILKYGPDRVSPAWDSVNALWHVFLMLANSFHSVTARQVAVSLTAFADHCVA